MPTLARSPARSRTTSASPRAARKGRRPAGYESLWDRLRALPLASVARRLRHRRLIRRSGLFDAGHYREQCRARDLRVRDPISHYLRIGAALGLDPHPLFDTGYYLDPRRNPDVVRQQANPLVHYLMHGDREGRCPGPRFDPTWYRAANPDVANAGAVSLAHYAQHGEREGRQGHPRFDAESQPDAPGSVPRGDLWRHFSAEESPGGGAWNRRQALRLHFEAADVAARVAGGAPVDDLVRENEIVRGLRRSGLFDADHYEKAWGTKIDESGDIERHFLRRGAIEGLPFCPPDQTLRTLERLQEELNGAARPELAYLGAARSSLPSDAGHRVELYVSSCGSAFFHEMTELLAHGLRRAGAEVQILDESVEQPPELGPREHALVVAPHEFFALGEGPRHVSRRFLSQSWLWLAEQPGSEFFAMCLWFARYARGVLDVNPLTALAWSELGMRARALPLGFVPDFQDYADAQEFESADVRAAQLPEARAPVSVDAPLAARPLDVFWNGVLTERREAFFSSHAWLFTDLRCALYMRTPDIPVSARVASALSARDATALTQRSQILLGVHRTETSHFDWHRLVVRGIWQKTLVLTEPSFWVPGLEPGRHYIECDLEDMPGKIEWLLHTDAGRAEAETIRLRAFDALQSLYPLPEMAAAWLVEAAEEPA